MKPVFKEYIQDQYSLFPERLDDYIPKNHVVRLVSSIVDKLDIEPIISTYKGGGTSSFHPRMMLKVLFYAYLNNIFSSRKIAKALRENIYFMWLSGKQFPDFRTINNFRSKRLKGHIQHIFSSIVIMLSQAGMLDIKKIAYTDGTKIEANASRYSFVWRGSINHNKSKLESRLKKILEEIESQIKEDNKEENKDTIEEIEIDKEFLQKKIEEINRKTKESSKLTDKEKEHLLQRIEKIEKDELSRLDKYDKALETMGDNRNSYSKTDTNATFMRMKEDHMKNGQLKAAYNVQISTQEQAITHFGICQNRTDTGTYIDHLESYNQFYGTYPQTVVADAGYGSEENYNYLEEHGIEAYVKYNWFHKEQKKKFKNDISRIENLYYNEEGDYFICPMGEKMHFLYRYTRKTDNGYEQEISVYQAQRCEGCPLRGVCNKSKGNKTIHVNHNLMRHKERIRKNLLSNKGIEYRKKRSIEPESVFGQIKQDKGFRRFLLRGIEKVTVEFGLIAISHNIQKLWKWLLDRIDSLNFMFFSAFLMSKISIFIKKLKSETYNLVFEQKIIFCH